MSAIAIDIAIRMNRSSFIANQYAFSFVGALIIPLEEALERD